MTTINFSPLKLILFGEHSVTTGEKCIAIAINKRNFITISKSSSPSITVIDIDNLKIDLSYLFDKKQAKDEVVISLGRSIGCGLGTSAAVSVLLAEYFVKNENCLNSEYKYIFDEKIKIECFVEQIYNKTENYDIFDDKKHKKNNKILNAALKIENLFHGRSSGVDVTSVFCTGLICYQNYKYTKLDTKFLKKYKILIFDSKIKKDTNEVIKKMQQFNAKKMHSKDEIYKEIGEIASKANELFKNDFNLKELYKLIRQNHDLLFELGVVPEKMQLEVNKLRAMGIESKITGAGCGGHLFTIVKKETTITNWEEIEVFED